VISFRSRREREVSVGCGHAASVTSAVAAIQPEYTMRLYRNGFPVNRSFKRKHLCCGSSPWRRVI